MEQKEWLFIIALLTLGFLGKFGWTLKQMLMAGFVFAIFIYFSDFK